MLNTLKRIAQWLGLILLLALSAWLLYQMVDLYGIPGGMLGTCFVFVVFTFYRWLKDLDAPDLVQSAVHLAHSKLKDSESDRGKVDSACGVTSESESDMVGERDSILKNNLPRWASDKLKSLEDKKADQTVVDLANARLKDKLTDLEEDVDGLKAAAMLPPSHDCLHQEVMGTMKEAIKANAENMGILSSRGFKIVMAAVGGLIILGSSALVWAVTLNATVNDNAEDIQRLEKAPPQMLIAAPDYVDQHAKAVNTRSPSSKKPAKHRSGKVVSVEKMLDKAISKAIEEALMRKHREANSDDDYLVDDM